MNDLSLLLKDIVSSILNRNQSLLIDDIHIVLKKILTKKEYKTLLLINQNIEKSVIASQLNCDIDRVETLHKQAIRKIKVKDNYFKGDSDG